MAKFFDTPKPKAFKVEPRFWDPEKEKREARERRIRAELRMTDEEGNYITGISKGDFRKGFSKGKWSAHSQRRKSNTRLLIIVILLLLVLFFIFK
jgi:hypothetical protein